MEKWHSPTVSEQIDVVPEANDNKYISKPEQVLSAIVATLDEGNGLQVDANKEIAPTSQFGSVPGVQQEEQDKIFGPRYDVTQSPTLTVHVLSNKGTSGIFKDNFCSDNMWYGESALGQLNV